MPNWCENRLIITGSKRTRRIFADFVENGDNKFNDMKILPRHQKFIDADAKHGPSTAFNLSATNHPEFMVDGMSEYDWNVKNRGTKWTIHDATICENKTSTVFGFQTAWSPPEPIIIEASKQFPRLKFNLRYWEGGAAYQGQLICKDGEIIKDVNYKYHGPKGG